MSGTRPRCPRCVAIELRRLGRIGFLQREIWSRMGYFPWECGQCREIYMLKQRSTGYRATAASQAAAPLIERLLLKDHN